MEERGRLGREKELRERLRKMHYLKCLWLHTMPTTNKPSGLARVLVIADTNHHALPSKHAWCIQWKPQ